MTETPTDILGIARAEQLPIRLVLENSTQWAIKIPNEILPNQWCIYSTRTETARLCDQQEVRDRLRAVENPVLAATRESPFGESG